MAIILEKELRMCGKAIYVTYFEFWNQPDFDERTIRKRMRDAKKKESGITMCIHAARNIAKSGLQLQALNVIAHSPRVDPTAQQKARQLIQTCDLR